jgi:F-type H+-transporting ATPase subunit gamma
MQTLEGLRRKLSTTRDLRDIVSTMKTLSAVSINQFEKAAVSLGEYDSTVHSGLTALLKGGETFSGFNNKKEGGSLAIVFGSDLGLVGRFNKEIVKKAIENVPSDTRFIAIGRRCLPQIDNQAGMGKVDAFFTLPSAVKDVVSTALAILVKIDNLCHEKDISNVTVFHNKKVGVSLAVPTKTEILPISENFIQKLKKEKWTTNQQPVHRQKTSDLFSVLIREQLLVWICRACAESLASEYATRLATMQAAEKNIDEHIETLTMQFQQRRQDSITEELLDVVSGSEVLNMQAKENLAKKKKAKQKELA